MNKPLICLLASPDTTASVLYGLYDVLGNVGPDYVEMLGGIATDSMLEVKIVARTPEPFICLSGIPVQPQASLDDIERADVVVVCDMYTPIDQSPLGKYTPEVQWLKRMHARDALLCSVCSGATLLAETGLLNGYEVSSHWAYRNLFQEYFPQVKWAPEPILNLSGENRRMVTSAGVTSWQDLAIYLVERFCGLSNATNTARVYLLARHDDGQLPYSSMSCSTRHNDAVVRDCQDWIEGNYKCSNPVSEMIDRSGLNSRTFARRFRSATGYQPIEYVQGLRIEAAKQMLESDATSVEVISSSVGYDDPASFRRIFKRKVGLTPARYRKKFSHSTIQSR
ncbi:MAG: helix-turn-helix domain-containing protein [Gammaproteobacteria bacterium]|nr:MAG: helix-turn-helix domain-containing protein [Gammaproteobacteria bacterium]